MNFDIALLLAQEGITNGAIYALLALALVLVFAVTRVIWVPSGEFVAFGTLTLAGLQLGKTPGTVGLLAGIWAEKFDQLAGVQNFVIAPLSFLSGVFYSIHSLPPAWQVLSRFNPFFYLIDGFRYGFFGAADVDPRFSIAFTVTALVVLAALALAALDTGYKLRH